MGHEPRAHQGSRAEGARKVRQTSATSGSTCAGIRRASAAQTRHRGGRAVAAREARVRAPRSAAAAARP